MMNLKENAAAVVNIEAAEKELSVREYLLRDKESELALAPTVSRIIPCDGATCFVYRKSVSKNIHAFIAGAQHSENEFDEIKCFKNIAQGTDIGRMFFT